MSDSLTLRLLSLQQGEESTWESHEYREILNHFLNCSIREVVSSAPPYYQDAFEHQHRELPCGATFGQMLESNPSPSLQLLRASKDAAKICIQCPELGVPQPVVNVLYYLAIASAFVHHKFWMTKLMPSEVREALRSVLQFDWLGERIKIALSAGLAHLSTAKG